MAFSLLITGGARSGKSSFAEQRVKEFGAPLVYIATAEAFDSEMKDRIALPQARRGTDWLDSSCSAEPATSATGG